MQPPDVIPAKAGNQFVCRALSIYLDRATIEGFPAFGAGKARNFFAYFVLFDV
jgi:hypothetical protein